MYDTVIFDLDGTLLDTLEDLAASVNAGLSGYTDVRRSLDEVRGFVGNGVRTLMARSLPGGMENPHYEEAFAAFRDHYAIHCRDHTGPYPGIMDMLSRLAQRGIRMGIVSNKGDREVKSMNRTYFSGLMGAALGERENVRRKPEPDSLLEAMKELGAVPERTLYVGDSEVDVQTALNAGVDLLAVTWGFRGEEQLRSSGAEHFAHSPEDIEAFLSSC